MEAKLKETYGQLLKSVYNRLINEGAETLATNFANIQEHRYEVNNGNLQESEESSSYGTLEDADDDDLDDYPESSESSIN